MSFLVKGIKMPKSCLECELIDGAEAPDCFLMYRAIKNPLQRQDYCPLVELPDKHGRLIDADAFVEYLENEFKSGYENDQKSDADMKMLITKMHELIITEIRKRPTVIESEEREAITRRAK